MKQAILSLFLVITSLLTSRLMAQNSKYLAIDQLNIPIDAATITDSSNGGRLIYLASFEISMRSNESVSALKMLYAAIAENRQLSLSIKTLDAMGKGLEERFYQNAGIQEIVLPLMDAVDKNLVKVQVKIRATSVSVKENSGSVNLAGIGRGAAVVNSNFRLAIGSLPTKRVSKISAIRIASGQPSSFSIELAESDSKDWQNWLTGSSSKREGGSIEWLAANFKDVAFQISLNDIEITSTSSQYISTTEVRQITKLNIGLRAKAVPGGGK
ncbi:hypothetical protein LZZ85_16885 [Terrimonas sp. NA20]|uniref:Uncharacterized protein n=1 Tax=Terrimonas ginsenosidimutans TaxID=2908004 RepID=A0ABS9KUJ6_9BACT|nr:hypothetical protein [Terrimonas ginsenosidimutans]MCG2615975.1 hypothetical protein [Terrimonas ginsenosidimutans]